jgi:hypothetical protein
MIRKIVILVSLMLLFLSIPVTFGERMQSIMVKEQIKEYNEDELTDKNIVTCTFVRGLVFNPIIKANSIQGKAIHIRCRDISFNQGQAYVMKGFEEVSFPNGLFMKINTFGLFGSLGYLNGFYFH